MLKIIMNIGLIGMIISIFIIFIPRNIITNGVDVPLYIKAGFWLSIVSTFVTLIGAFVTSELGEILLT